MKTAILLTGNTRTWDKCKAEFINSFGHLNPDLYVATYDLQYCYHPAQRHWMGNNEDVILTEDDIKKLYSDLNLIKLSVESIENAEQHYESIKNSIHENFKHEKHTYLQYRKLKHALEMMCEYEKINGISYDLVIKLRTDVLYHMFDFKIQNTDVIISTGNVYPNDVIIASKRDNIVTMADFILNEMFTPIYADSHLNCPHTLLLRSIEHAKLNIIQKQLMRFVVRLTGNHYYN